MLEYHKPSSIVKEPNETKDFVQCLIAGLALILLMLCMPIPWLVNTKIATIGKWRLKGNKLMTHYTQIPDITQQQEEQPFRYTRRLVEEEPPLEIIAECHLCGVLIEDGQEVLTYADQTFCSQYHVEEYKEMESVGEVA